MTSAFSGAVNLTFSVVQTVNPGSGLTSYQVPINPGAQSAPYATGTGPNQIQKAAQLSLTATGAPVDTDLTTVQCSDGTTGFSHVRERILINLDGTNPLKTGDDGVVSNPWVPYNASGTHPVRTIEPGAVDRVSKPLGANGYAVGSTSKVIRVDPGAYTVNFMLIILGD